MNKTTREFNAKVRGKLMLINLDANSALRRGIDLTETDVPARFDALYTLAYNRGRVESLVLSELVCIIKADAWKHGLGVENLKA